MVKWQGRKVKKARERRSTKKLAIELAELVEAALKRSLPVTAGHERQFRDLVSKLERKAFDLPDPIKRFSSLGVLIEFFRLFPQDFKETDAVLRSQAVLLSPKASLNFQAEGQNLRGNVGSNLIIEIIVGTVVPTVLGLVGLSNMIVPFLFFFFLYATFRFPSCRKLCIATLVCISGAWGYLSFKPGKRTPIVRVNTSPVPISSGANIEIVANEFPGLSFQPNESFPELGDVEVSSAIAFTLNGKTITNETKWPRLYLFESVTPVLSNVSLVEQGVGSGRFIANPSPGVFALGKYIATLDVRIGDEWRAQSSPFTTYRKIDGHRIVEGSMPGYHDDGSVRLSIDNRTLSIGGIGPESTASWPTLTSELRPFSFRFRALLSTIRKRGNGEVSLTFNKNFGVTLEFVHGRCFLVLTQDGIPLLDGTRRPYRKRIPFAESDELQYFWIHFDLSRIYLATGRDHGEIMGASIRQTDIEFTNLLSIRTKNARFEISEYCEATFRCKIIGNEWWAEE